MCLNITNKYNSENFGIYFFNDQGSLPVSQWQKSDATSLLFPSNFAILDPNWMALFGNRDDAKQPSNRATSLSRHFSPSPQGRLWNQPAG